MAIQLPTAANIKRVNPSSIPGVRVSPESFGADVAQAQQGLAGAAFDLSIKVRDEAEKAEAQDLANKMSEFSRILEMGNGLPDGDPNQKVGYRSLQGLNAVNQRPAYEKDLDDEYERLEGLASSDRVKRMFAPVALNHIERTRTAFGTIAIREQKVYESKVAEATIRELSDTAVANSDSLRVVRANISAVYSTALDQAKKLYGTSPSGISGVTMAESEAQKVVTAVHEAVFTDLLSKDPSAAEEYLKLIDKNNKKKKSQLFRGLEIDPIKLTELREKAEVGTRLVLSQDVVAALDDQTDLADWMNVKGYGLREKLSNLRSGKFDDDLKGPRNLTNPRYQEWARAFVGKHYKGKDEKAIMEALNRRIREVNANQVLRKGEVAAAAQRHIFGGGTIQSFMRENPDDFKIIAGDGSLMSQLNRKEALIKFRPNSDNLTYKTLLEDPVALVKADLNALRGDLTKPEYDKLVLKQGSEKAKLELVKRGRGQVIKEADAIVVQQAPKRLRKRTLSEENLELVTDARADLTVWIKDYVEENDKVPSRDEIRRQATRMWLKISADPENTGTFGTARTGEEEIETYAFLADEVNALSPQQREVARIAFSKIPVRFIRDIQKDVQRYLKDQRHRAPFDAASSLDDDDYENLAAAILLGDERRALRIMKEIESR